MNKAIKVGDTIVALDEDLHYDRIVKIGKGVKQTEEGEYLIADEDLAYLLAVGYILQGVIQNKESEDSSEDNVKFVPGLIH